MNRILDTVYALAKRTNKVGGIDGEEVLEGAAPDKYPELKLNMDDEAILSLTREWKQKWENSSLMGEWKEKWEANEKYYLGKHYDIPSGSKNRPMVDNAIFEAVETFRPQATRRNPEPMVLLSNREMTSEGLEGPEKEQLEAETKRKERFASDIQKELADIADNDKLKMKMKDALLHWSIYLVGVVRMGWDMDTEMPKTAVIRPQKLILDPDATVDADGYTGEYIGEYRKVQASTLIAILKDGVGEPGCEAVIKEKANGKLGTNITYIEWHTDTYVCWTMDGNVLYKAKNPNWNYDKEEEEEQVDDYGETTMGMKQIEGVNHFPAPKKPYVFLSIFNLGKHPVDDTSLIGQNLANQDAINKRNRQIDKHADNTNNGLVISGERSGLTKDQAAGVSEAVRKGGVIFIPTGAPQDAIQRLQAPSLSPDIYQDLVDKRNRMLDIFGVRGSAPSGVQSEDTVRGKILNKNLDTDRIGGGISEYLEQMADDIFNWMVQLLYVYDPAIKAMPEKPKLTISVKEGSLLPKDSTTLANQAVDLATAGMMSKLDLYKKLDYSNPEEMAVNSWLEINAPDLLYPNDPRVKEALDRMSAPVEEKKPVPSMNIKDMTPDAQAQALAMAGIRADPEAIAAHRQDQEDQTQEREMFSADQNLERDLNKMANKPVSTKAE